MGVDGSQRIGAALTPRFGVASASAVLHVAAHPGSRDLAEKQSLRSGRSGYPSYPERSTAMLLAAQS
ncbi:unnamed protein product [Pleuronectes platessa]|uniref:Uncharacterized protein n=1 Tax=Pleuronectes platessa TaxID=8262 RepID=A0A9N7V2W5_PLEPL|nr:unnamed protein product [Pleuronectes platessa]